MTTVFTETSVYRIDWEAMVLFRYPGAPTESAGLTFLRKDGEAIPLIAMLQMEVGKPMLMWLDIRGDGVATYRQTTWVQKIID